MKKSIYLILSVLAAFASACSEDVGDYTVRGEALTTFESQSPVNNYTVTVNKSTPEATVDFTWTASTSGLGSPVSYRILFDRPESNFTAPLLAVTAGNEGKATAAAVTYSQLQGIAEKTKQEDGIYEISWCIEASNASGVKKFSLPTSLKFTVPETGVTAIQLKSPADACLIALNKITKPNEKLTFKWEKSTASDGSAIQYQLLADEAGNNFETPILSTVAADIDSASFTTAELVEKFNTAGFTKIDMILEWKVVAIAGTHRFSSSTYRTAFSIADIPFVYIVGDATPAGWDPEKGIEMAKVEDGVYSVTTKLFAGDKGWKFLAGKSWEETAWGPAEATPAPMQGTLSDAPGGPNIPAPAEDGSYKITVDFNTMTYKVEQGAPERLYIIGDVLGSKVWNNSNQDYILFKDNNDAGEKIYTYTGYFKAGEFKFISEKDLGTWNNLYGEGGNGTLSQNGGNITAITTEGYYTLTVNLTDLTYSVTPYSTENKPSYTHISLIGNGGNWGTDIDLQPTDYDPHIWTTTATLQAGDIKFRADHDWATGWGEGETEYGIGSTTPGGGNIQVKATGEYFVKFNDLTGHFVFVQSLELNGN